MISDDAKEFMLLKNQQELEVLKKVDKTLQFMEKMGFRETLDETKEKLTLKP